MKKTYAMQFRRKRNGKTDYRKRLKLLISRKPRLIVRKTLANFVAQFADYEPKGDLIRISANSQELKKLGWKYGTSNISAAYLTGLLAGRKALKIGIKEAIADIGLTQSKKGTRIYAAIKGVSDSGVKIPHSNEILPSQERIEGKHIAQYASLLKQDQVKYNKQFSKYIKQNVLPEKISEEFKKIKDAIMKV